MKIGFICPTYNARALDSYTRVALESFYDTTPGGVAIVVDDASSIDPYLRAATMSEQMGDLDAAKQYLRTGWEVDPSNATVQERLRSYGVIPGPTLAMPSSGTR